MPHTFFTELLDLNIIVFVLLHLLLFRDSPFLILIIYLSQEHNDGVSVVCVKNVLCV